MDDKIDEPENEEVGYRRPPKASQFKKGETGNPKGRPRNTPGRKAIAARVLGEVQRLSGQARGARVRYTTLEVIVMALKQLAASGHSAASAFYVRFLERYSSQDSDQRQFGYIVLPQTMTEEEWVAKYSPKDEPPGGYSDE